MVLDYILVVKQFNINTMEIHYEQCLELQGVFWGGDWLNCIPPIENSPCHVGWQFSFKCQSHRANLNLYREILLF